MSSSHVEGGGTRAGSPRAISRSLALLGHELRMQQLLFWRNRESAVFVFVFPPMLFLLLGSVYSDTIDGERAVDVLLVGMLGYGCANTALAGLAISLVVRRESGMLKRLRATPLPAWTYLSAVVLSTLAHCGRCRACEVGRPTECRNAPNPKETQPFTVGGAPAYQFANVSAFAERTIVPMLKSCCQFSIATWKSWRRVSRSATIASIVQ